MTEINKKIREKANKSSIIRVIISNFDDEQIKEIKVLYNKQGGLDIIELNGTKKGKDGKIIFDYKRAYNMREEVETKLINSNIDEKFTVKANGDKTELYITKKRNSTDDIIRKYKLYGFHEGKNSEKVIVSIEDEREYTDKKEISEKRALKRSTNRILLSKQVKENSEQIACSDMVNNGKEKVIDSKEIYKINKFLSYRSNMIMYYQIINNFLIKGYETGNNEKKIKEIWEYKKDEDKFIELTAEYLYGKLSDFIENHNNKAKKNVKSTEFNGNYREKPISIDKDMLKEDVKEILFLLSGIRHALVHYNYEFFEKLFTGKDCEITYKENKTKKSSEILESEDKTKKLSELLDLKIFNELNKIKILKNEAKTNYLDKNSKIYVLGKDVNAIKLLNIYNDICDTKNGFNKFINEIISESGEENQETKEIIKKDFEIGFEKIVDTIENSSNKKQNDNLEKKRKEQDKLKKWFNAPYIYDIHSSKKYKELYVEKKNLVAEYNKQKVSNRNKDKITKLNKKLYEINNKLKEMTSLNSKYRLQYKMQLAFGFLKEKYNLNIEKFKDEFNLEEKENYKKDIENYIKSKSDRTNSELDIKNFIKNYKIKDLDNLFGSNMNNNLAKLYTLIYLLLPVEIRGDFLGFVKENYYDMKHVDFIEGEDKDTFFHDLRLFEKNSRNLEIFNYNFMDSFFNEENKGKLNEIFKKAVSTKDQKILKYIELENYNKALVLPIMKYYQNIFKLLNDIEIISLFKYEREKKGNNSFKKTIEAIEEKTNGYYNFTYLMKHVTGENKRGMYQIRNDLAHINMVPLYLCELKRYVIKNNYELEEKTCEKRGEKYICKKDDKSISQRINTIIEFLEEKQILRKHGFRDNKKYSFGDNEYLYKNVVNDYLMKKEKLVNNLILGKDENNLNIERTIKSKANNEALEEYKLKKLGKEIYIQKVMNKVSELENEVSKLEEEMKKSKQNNVDNMKETVKLKKDISIMNGFLKNYFNRLLREIALDIIQEGEIRYLNIDIYDKNKNTNKRITKKYRCNIENGQRLYTDLNNNQTELEKDGIIIKNLDSSIIKVNCERDKKEEERKKSVNLEEHYIQTIKFVV